MAAPSKGQHRVGAEAGGRGQLPGDAEQLASGLRLMRRDRMGWMKPSTSGETETERAPSCPGRSEGVRQCVHGGPRGLGDI